MGYGSGDGTAVALVTAVARVQSLARELLHAMGMAKKRREREREEPQSIHTDSPFE